MDRRTLFGVGGAGLLCTLAGAEVAPDGPAVDLTELARGLADPPSLRTASARQASAVQPAPGGAVRESGSRPSASRGRSCRAGATR